MDRKPTAGRLSVLKVNAESVSLIGAACGATVMMRRIVLAVRTEGLPDNCDLARLNSTALLNHRAYQRRLYTEWTVEVLATIAKQFEVPIRFIEAEKSPSGVCSSA